MSKNDSTGDDIKPVADIPKSRLVTFLQRMTSITRAKSDTSASTPSCEKNDTSTGAIVKIEKHTGENNDTSASMSYDEKLAAEYFGNSTPTTGLFKLTSDDPETLAFTFRAVFLGLVWGIFYGCIDTVFSFRTNDFVLPQALLKILVLPCGHFMSRILPTGILNPGKFTVKEHVLITIIAGAAGGVPHGIDNVIMQKSDKFLNDPDINFFNGFAWVAVTQLIGLGVAGFLIRFLVKPASLYWPHTISCCALFTTLHSVETEGAKSIKYPMSRLKFFWIVGGIFFIYHWIPTFFVTSVGSIAVLCLVTNNRTARFLGSSGSNAGVGLFALTFDFTIGHGEQPYIQPWWATINWLISKIAWEYTIVPILYYTNYWDSPILLSSYYYPDGEPFGTLNSLKIFNASGYPIKIARQPATNNDIQRRNIPTDNYNGFNNLLDDDFGLDLDKFDAHQPFYITEFHAIYNFTRFISITASISYIYLWYGKDIRGWVYNGLKGGSVDNGSIDVHNRLMKAYKDVPEKFWILWLLGFSVVTIIVCLVTPFYLPIWASILAIIVGIIGTFLNGFLRAISGARISNALVAEVLIGYMSPGNIIVCAAFQSLCRNVELQAVELLADLKLGHYLHIAPPAMVACQIIGVAIGSFVNVATAFYVLDVMTEPKIFSDPAWLGVMYEKFVNTAGIWGAIGPDRFFGPGTPYSTLYFGFLIGIVFPFIPYILNKFIPHHWWHMLNPALLFNSLFVGNLQSGAIYHMVIGFIFQFYIFRYKKEWFDKYLYVLAAALSLGAGVCLFLSVLLVTVFPNLKPSRSIFNPGSVDWYCFGGDPSDSSKGGINQ